MRARSDLPKLIPPGVAMRQIREQLGLRQEDVAKQLGFGASGQTSMSYRERDPAGDRRAVEPSHDELVKFEDLNGLQRGTVLRAAGYVVDAAGPLEQVESCSCVRKYVGVQVPPRGWSGL